MITKGNKQILLLGVIALLGSSYFLARNALTILQGTKVTAEVMNVETVSTPGSGTSRTYRPTVRFTREDGEIMKMDTGYSSTTFKFSRGDKIPVYYKTANPSDFRIATFMSMWAAPLVGMLLAALILYSAFKLIREDNPTVKQDAKSQTAHETR